MSDVTNTAANNSSASETKESSKTETSNSRKMENNDVSRRPGQGRGSFNRSGPPFRGNGRTPSGRNDRQGGNRVDQQHRPALKRHSDGIDGFVSKRMNQDGQSRYSREGGGGPNARDSFGGRRGIVDKVQEKLSQMMGPSYDLEPVEDNSKFVSQCRLYAGNLNANTEEKDIRELFETYGEICEVYHDKTKNFAFIRMDYRQNAEKARNTLDGSTDTSISRMLKVRFAPTGTSVQVKNLSPYVTDELLRLAFSAFGEIQSARVLVDEKNASICEGIVEFTRKPMAADALKRCSDGVFFLTGSLRPVIVEPYEELSTGLSEKCINKDNEYYRDREVGPRFANTTSWDFKVGMEYKKIYERYNAKAKELKESLKAEEETLFQRMKLIKDEYEAQEMRNQLARREEELAREKKELEQRLSRRFNAGPREAFGAGSPPIQRRSLEGSVVFSRPPGSQGPFVKFGDQGGPRGSVNDLTATKMPMPNQMETDGNFDQRKFETKTAPWNVAGGAPRNFSGGPHRGPPSGFRPNRQH